MKENNTYKPLLTVNVYEDRVTIDGDDVRNPHRIGIDVNEVRYNATKKIHEGDIVKIVDSGKMYTTYVNWIAEHIADEKQMIRFAYGQNLTDEHGELGEIKGKQYKVIKIVDDIAFIERLNDFTYRECHLINLKGLAKC